MIRKLSLSVVLILATSQLLQSQNLLLYGIFPASNGKIFYEKDITVDSTTKEELFTRVQKWALSTYKDQKDTLKSENKNLGSLSYKGFVTAVFNEPSKNVAGDWNCWYDIKIICDNNHAKVIITNLEQKSPSGYGNLTTIPLEKVKNKTDSLPNAVFFGKNSREVYWNAQLVTLKEIDGKIKALIGSLEKSLQ